MKYNILIFLLPLFLFSSCFSGVIASVNYRMPEERPDDLLINMYSHSGLAGLYEDMNLHEDSCTFRTNYAAADNKFVSFRLSEKEMDELYKVIRDNSFEDIETETKNIADRGGISVKLKWGSEKILVSNSGTNFVKKEWMKEWDNIINALNEVKNKNVISSR